MAQNPPMVIISCIRPGDINLKRHLHQPKAQAPRSQQHGAIEHRISAQGHFFSHAVHLPSILFRVSSGYVQIPIDFHEHICYN